MQPLVTNSAPSHQTSLQLQIQSLVNSSAPSHQSNNQSPILILVNQSNLWSPIQPIVTNPVTSHQSSLQSSVKPLFTKLASSRQSSHCSVIQPLVNNPAASHQSSILSPIPPLAPNLSSGYQPSLQQYSIQSTIQLESETVQPPSQLYPATGQQEIQLQSQQSSQQFISRQFSSSLFKVSPVSAIQPPISTTIQPPINNQALGQQSSLQPPIQVLNSFCVCPILQPSAFQHIQACTVPIRTPIGMCIQSSQTVVNMNILSSALLASLRRESTKPSRFM